MEEIIIDSSSDEEDSVPWETLPPNVLERIYGFLNRGDRSRMSLVCHRWSRQYSSPSLWRNMEFCVRIQRCKSVLYPEVIFAQKYARYLRHVKIIFEPLHDDCQTDAIKQLIMFLHVLTGRCRLYSLSVMYFYFHLPLGVYHPLYEEVLDSVKGLVETQTSLKTLEFHGDCFATRDTMGIVKAAFSRENWSVRNLTLKCFSNGFIEDCRKDEIVDTIIIPYLIYIEKLEINYSQFFEKIVFEILRCTQDACTTTSNHVIRTLKRLILHCDGKCGQYSDGRYLGISSLAWKHIRNACPELVTELHFSNWCDSFAMGLEFYIVRDMPLKTLHFELFPDFNAQISFLLRHLVLSGVCENLEVLTIDWPLRIPRLGFDLKESIHEFPKLKRLALHVYHYVTDLPVVLNSLLLHRPKSLSELHIKVTPSSFCAVRSPDYKTLKNHFVPSLQVLGLKMTLTVE